MSEPLLSFYGDDFTGSTDALEVLTWAGMNAVLFVDPPDAQALKAHGALDAFGVAGTSRTMTPEEMEVELRATLQRMRQHHTRITHYKTCSTFDSSPQIGSIGRVMDIARDYYPARPTPIIVGAPPLGRYMLFGNLYARAGLDGPVFRLDRHPTMATHPVTPMYEADLLRHLRAQTAQKIGLIDYLQLCEPYEAILHRLEDLRRQGYDAAFLDVSEESQLETLGQLLTALSSTDEPLFVVGSSGVEYALVEALRPRPTGRGVHVAQKTAHTPHTDAVDESLTPLTTVCVSGSCSPITAEQILYAQRKGFLVLNASPTHLIDPATASGELDRLVHQAKHAHARNQSVIVETAAGPADPRIHAVHGKAAALGIDNVTRAIANATAELTQQLVEACQPQRLIVAGGDTSSLSARRIGIQALRAIAPIAPGGPLCRAYAPGCTMDGREVVFKGGQVGRTNFLVQASAVQAATAHA